MADGFDAVGHMNRQYALSNLGGASGANGGGCLITGGTFDKFVGKMFLNLPEKGWGQGTEGFLNKPMLQMNNGAPSGGFLGLAHLWESLKQAMQREPTAIHQNAGSLGEGGTAGGGGFSSGGGTADSGGDWSSSGGTSDGGSPMQNMLASSGFVAPGNGISFGGAASFADIAAPSGDMGIAAGGGGMGIS